MNSLGPQSYSVCLKRLIPADFTMKKEAITLMCSIIYEINESFITACLSNKNGAKDVTVKHVEGCIRPVIPKPLRTQAFEAGFGEIGKLKTGEIIYKGPKIPKPLKLEPSMLRKGLEQLAVTSHPNLTLSKNCSTIRSIIHRLGERIAEQSLSTIGHNPELCLEDMRNIVHSMLGDELFDHAEGHAACNMNWYSSGDLDFELKPLHSDSMEVNLEVETEFVPGYIQKLARSQYSISLPKNTARAIDNKLMAIANKILEDTEKFIENKALQNDAVSENVMYEVIQNLLPPTTFNLACAQAQGQVFNYSCGLFPYEYKRPEEIEAVAVGIDEGTEEIIVPDFSKTIRRLMEEYNYTAARGFLPRMNTILNDIAVPLAEMCSLSAQANDKILSENDVIAAVSALLPEGLKNHAFARIAHVGRECLPQNKQVMDKLNVAPNSAQYELEDQEHTLSYKPSYHSYEFMDASSLERNSVGTIESDSKDVTGTQSPELQKFNISPFYENRYSIADTDDNLQSSFINRSHEKSNIMEEMPQEQSYTSFESPIQGKEPSKTFIKQLSRESTKNLQHDIFGNSSRESNIDDSLQNQIPQSNVISISWEQRLSTNNDATLCSPFLSPRGSKNLEKNLLDEKDTSLERVYPVTKSTSKSYEEKSAENSQNETVSNLSYENQVKRDNQYQVPEANNGSVEQNDEMLSSRVLTTSSKEPNTFEDKQYATEKRSAVESKLTFDGNEKGTKSSEESMDLVRNSVSQNQEPQLAASSSDARRSSQTNAEKTISSFYSLLQQASNSILYPFQERQSSSKESVGQNIKSSLDSFRPIPETNTVLDSNKEHNGSLDQDTARPFLSENNMTPNKVTEDKYSTNDQQRSTVTNKESRSSGIFNLLLQASNNLLYPFQERKDPSQEKIQQSGKSVSDDVEMKSSVNKIKTLPADSSSRGSIKSVNVVSQNGESNSRDIMTSESNVTEDAYSLSTSADGKETFITSVSEQSKKFEENVETEHESESETIFLDIPKVMFWTDVKPHEF